MHGDEIGLIERLKRGEDAAFETLVRSHASHLMAVARRYVRNDEDAADVVQEAFLAAFKSIGTFDGDSKVSTWLHRIVVNASLMKLRGARRRPSVSIEEMLPSFREDGHQQNSTKAWNVGGAGGIERTEVRELVRACIERLPETHRIVLMMRDIDGIDTAATAELLGIGESAVKTRLHRARQALRELLAPHFSEETP